MKILVAECVAMAAIGDGVVGALFPAQHAGRWAIGPAVLREAARWFAERPALTRVLSVAELAAGIVLVSRLPARPA